MKLLLNKESLRDIEVIQNWFKDAFGFIPSRKQAVMFAIQSIKSVVAETIVKKRTEYIEAGEVAISIPNEYGNTLEYYVACSGDLFVNPSFLAETLLMHRATSLPKIIKGGLQVLSIKQPYVAQAQEVLGFIKMMEMVGSD